MMISQCIVLSLEQLVQLSGAADVASFHMFVYKMRPCGYSEPHPWQNCPYSHQGERARRRDFRYFRYSSAMCPNVSTERGSERCCPAGDACSLSHNVFEVWLHPEKYRTQLCPEAGRCQRMHCWYAHSQSELRQSCDIPDVLPTAVAAAAPGQLPVVPQAAGQQASSAAAAGIASRTAAEIAGRQQLPAGRASSSRGNSTDRTNFLGGSSTEPRHPAATALQPHAQGAHSMQQQRRAASAQQQALEHQRRSLEQRQAGLQPPYTRQLLRSPVQQAGPMAMQQRPHVQGAGGWVGSSPMQLLPPQQGLSMHMLQYSQAMQQMGGVQSMLGHPQAAYMQVPMQQQPQAPPSPAAAGAAVSLGQAQLAWMQQQHQQQMLPYYSPAMTPAGSQFQQQQLRHEFPPGAAGFQQVQPGVYHGQQAAALAQQQARVSQGLNPQQVWVMPSGVPYAAAPAAAAGPGLQGSPLPGGVGRVYMPGPLPPAYDTGVGAGPPGGLMVGGAHAAPGPHIPVSLGVVDLSHMRAAATPSAGSSGAALHMVPGVDSSATLLGSVTPQAGDFSGAAGVYAAQGGVTRVAGAAAGARAAAVPTRGAADASGGGGEFVDVQQLMQQMRLQGEPQ